MKYTLEINGEPEHHIFCSTIEDVKTTACAVFQQPWEDLERTGFRVVSFRESIERRLKNER